MPSSAACAVIAGPYAEDSAILSAWTPRKPQPRGGVRTRGRSAEPGGCLPSQDLEQKLREGVMDWYVREASARNHRLPRLLVRPELSSNHRHLG